MNSKLILSELEFELILIENHPNFELINEPSFVEEWRFGVSYYQEFKRISDGQVFNMTYRKDIKNEIYSLVGSDNIGISFSKKDIYNQNGTLKTHDHPPKPKPKTEMELLAEQAKNLETKPIDEFQNIPPKELFDFISSIKETFKWNEYRKVIFNFSIKYKVEFNSVHHWINKYKSSKTKQKMKKQYKIDYELLQKGFIEFKTADGSSIALTKEDVKNLQKLI